jgi:hypothetical protein
MTGLPRTALAWRHPAPVLDNPASYGKPYLFDEDTPTPLSAIRLCLSCPALAACRRWFDATPPTQRPTGVIAGRIHRPKRRTQHNTGGTDR